MSNPNPTLLDYLKTWPLYLLPQHTLSAIIRWLMRIRISTIKNTQIRLFNYFFNVNMNEAQAESTAEFEHFNAFFTRALKPDARTFPAAAELLGCPVDGAVSEVGDIRENKLIQAKNHDYDLAALLGGDKHFTEVFKDGKFATLYLSPRDYHRIHMPIYGTLEKMVYVPGRLFGVNNASVKTIPQLFAHNERVIAYFSTPAGPMAMILVGAIFVSSIETVWHGVVNSPRLNQIKEWTYTEKKEFDKGVEMGRFNMGSTVILLFPSQSITWDGSLTAGKSVRMGNTLASIAKHQQ